VPGLLCLPSAVLASVYLLRFLASAGAPARRRGPYTLAGASTRPSRGFSTYSIGHAIVPVLFQRVVLHSGTFDARCAFTLCGTGWNREIITGRPENLR